MLKKGILWGGVILFVLMAGFVVADVKRSAAGERIHAARTAHHKAIMSEAAEKTDALENGKSTEAVKPNQDNCSKMTDPRQKAVCEKEKKCAAIEDVDKKKACEKALLLERRKDCSRIVDLQKKKVCEKALADKRKQESGEK